jgi:DNA-binding cell septation regulator SpoVG
MPEKAKPAGACGGHRRITVSNWKPLDRGSLRGFLTLSLPSGFVINNCQLIDTGHSQWIGMPARCIVAADGSKHYAPTVEYVTKRARRRFEKAALDAVAAFLRARGEW